MIRIIIKLVFGGIHNLLPNCLKYKKRLEKITPVNLVSLKIWRLKKKSSVEFDKIIKY